MKQSDFDYNKIFPVTIDPTMDDYEKNPSFKKTNIIIHTPHKEKSILNFTTIKLYTIIIVEHIYISVMHKINTFF